MIQSKYLSFLKHSIVSRRTSSKGSNSTPSCSLTFLVEKAYTGTRGASFSSLFVNLHRRQTKNHKSVEVHQSVQRIYQLVVRPMKTKPLHIELPQWKDVTSMGDSLLELKPGHNSVLGKEFLQESSKVRIVEPALCKDVTAFGFWVLISQHVCLRYILHTYPGEEAIRNDFGFPCSE
jgi:hypothetical protein